MNVSLTGNAAPLVAYNYEMHEGLAIQMYGLMKADGEFEQIFGQPWTLTNFLQFFKMQVGLVFLDDDKGIWFAAWVRQVLPKVAEVGMWVRKDCRQRREGLLAQETAIARVLNLYSTILGLSRPSLISIHKRLGYRHVGTLCDGVEIFTLTAETFKPRLYREK